MLASLLLGGCGAIPQTAKSHGVKLPTALAVDDSSGRTLHLHLRSVVENGSLSSGYGSRRNVMGGGGTERHQGLDIAAPRGSAVRAAAAGTVVATGLGSRYGRFIRIRHSDRIETFYAHLSRYADKIRPGAPVKQDEIVGYVGSTGRSTGPHLHFELRRNGHPVDPLNYRL
jgi:murein DD-endopeptidase MepM/ murein hydrolase activator NlpD